MLGVGHRIAFRRDKDYMRILCRFFMSCFASSVLLSSAASASVTAALNAFVSEAVSPGREITSAISLKDSFSSWFYEERNSQELRRLNDLIGYIEFLKSRVLFFERNNALILGFIDPLCEIDPMFDEQARRLRDDGNQLFSDMLVEDFLIRPVTHVNHAVQILKNLESALLIQLKKMQIVNDELRSLKIQIALYYRGLNRLHERDQNLSQHLDMQAIMQQKEKTIYRQSQDIADLRRQIDQMALGMDVFRDRLQNASEKIDRLVHDVTAASLDLYQKELEYSNTYKQAESMAAEFYETKERLSLVQRIIQEKDLHIQKLKDELVQIQEKIPMRPADGSVDILREEMKCAIDDLKLEIARSQEKIQRMEERFQEAALVNAQLESDGEKKDSMISFLEKQAIQNRTLIIGLEQNFRARAEQLEEMQGIVKIYQMKLCEYKDMVEERDDFIRKMIEARGTGPVEDAFSSGNDTSDHQTVFHVPDTILWSAELIGDVSKDTLDRF